MKRAAPTLATARYRKALRTTVAKALQRAYAPLLRQLQNLLPSTTRTDAPSDDLDRLLDTRAIDSELRDVTSAARDAAVNISAHTKGELRRQLNRSRDERVRGISLTESPRLLAMAERFATENAALVKRIAPDVAASIRQIVLDGFAGGDRHEVIAARIQERLDIGIRRAEFIAIDQIGKLDGEMTAQRHRDIGVTHFLWRSSNDERVRGNPDGKYPNAKPSHYDRNGQRYAYASPPEGKDGRPELPGVPPRCRCYAEPDLSTLTSAQSPEAESQQKTAQPQPKTIEELEAEANAAVAEVEAMLAGQQAEIAQARSADPIRESQSQVLEMQFRALDRGTFETAVARHRRWLRRGEQVGTR